MWTDEQEEAAALDVDGQFGLIVQLRDGSRRTVRTGEVSVRGPPVGIHPPADVAAQSVPQLIQLLNHRSGQGGQGHLVALPLRRGAL